jgi:hypothetical protein
MGQLAYIVLDTIYINLGRRTNEPKPEPLIASLNQAAALSRGPI